MNYYRRYMGDYAAKTADLSLTEHGAYNVLLDICYSTEKPLPGSHEALYRLCRAMSKLEQAAVRSVADRFFPLGDDGLRRNPRTTEEIAKAQATIAKQRESGVESAAKRWSTDGSTHPAPIQPPTSNLQPLTTNPQEPTTNPQPPTETQSQKRSGGGKKPPLAGRMNGKPATAETWTAYETAYRQRYGVEPTRNAKVNGLLARFIERVPAPEAPQIAAWYVATNRGLYVTAKHAVDLLLRDAEGLRTEWLCGRSVTETEARQTDRTQATGNVFAPLIAEAEALERASGAE